MSAKFEVYRDRAQRFRWRLVAHNGRITGDSGQGYDSRSAAHRAVETVRSEVGKAPIADV